MTMTQTLQVRFRLSAGDHFFQEKAHQQPNLMGKWLKVDLDPVVDEALGYYSQQHDWPTLYKIYMIIKKDVGRSENTGALPRGTFDKWTQNRVIALNFEQSANDFNRSGTDARHSSMDSHSVPTATTISLQEANKIVDDLLIKWLEIKSKL